MYRESPNECFILTSLFANVMRLVSGYSPKDSLKSLILKSIFISLPVGVISANVALDYGLSFNAALAVCLLTAIASNNIIKFAITFDFSILAKRILK